MLRSSGSATLRCAASLDHSEKMNCGPSSRPAALAGHWARLGHSYLRMRGGTRRGSVVRRLAYLLERPTLAIINQPRSTTRLTRPRAGAWASFFRSKWRRRLKGRSHDAALLYCVAVSDLRESINCILGRSRSVNATASQSLSGLGAHAAAHPTRQSRPQSLVRSVSPSPHRQCRGKR